MGKVSDYVADRVRQSLNDGGPVVWFDPEGTYSSVASRLEEELMIYRYDESFLKLRHDLDYIQRMSTFLDLKIFFLSAWTTAIALVKRRRPGHSEPQNQKLQPK